MYKTSKKSLNSKLAWLESPSMIPHLSGTTMELKILKDQILLGGKLLCFTTFLADRFWLFQV